MRWRICDGTWYVFFFKRKTAYDMRIIDWSSDVCSSDLLPLLEMGGGPRLVVVRPHLTVLGNLDAADRDRQPVAVGLLAGDRKSGVQGKSVSVSVDLGGRRFITHKRTPH